MSFNVSIYKKDYENALNKDFKDCYFERVCYLRNYYWVFKIKEFLLKDNRELINYSMNFHDLDISIIEEFRDFLKEVLENKDFKRLNINQITQNIQDLKKEIKEVILELENLIKSKTSNIDYYISID